MQTKFICGTLPPSMTEEIMTFQRRALLSGLGFVGAAGLIGLSACKSTQDANGNTTETLNVPLLLSLATSVTTGIGKMLNDANARAVIGDARINAVLPYLSHAQAIEADIAARISDPVSITIGKDWVSNLLRDADQILSTVLLFKDKLPPKITSLLSAVQFLEPEIEALVGAVSLRSVGANPSQTRETAQRTIAAA
jgi:hypothetical protein